MVLNIKRGERKEKNTDYIHTAIKKKYIYIYIN